MTGLTVPANSRCAGKPVLAALSNEHQLLLASLVWWSVFYSPGDLAYSLATNKVGHVNLLPLSNTTIQLLYVPICVVKEIYRAKKVVGGMKDASKLFPDNELIIIAIGTLKGNGSGFMKPITRLISGDWSPARSELLQVSVTSKGCLAAGALLLASSQG